MSMESDKSFVLDALIKSAYLSSFLTSVFYVFHTGSFLAFPFVFLTGIGTIFPLLVVCIFPVCLFLYRRDISNIVFWVMPIVALTSSYAAFFSIILDEKINMVSVWTYGGTGFVMSLLLWVRLFVKSQKKESVKPGE